MDNQQQVEKTYKPVRQRGSWRAWLPSRGNVLFVLLVAGALLLYVRTAGAVPGEAPAAASNSIIPYQGRLADAGGNALNGSFAMTFKLYSVSSAGSPLWTEAWSGGNSISVTTGLFNVLLGSLTPISPTLFSTNGSLWLGITVGADSEMVPRVQLGSAPYSFVASQVKQSNLVSNVQTVFEDNVEKSVVGATFYVDLISTTVSATQPAIFRMSYHSMTWKMVAEGRTVIGIRVDGAPNTWVEDSCVIAAGMPVSASYPQDSENLSGVCFVPVAAGVHIVTLVLGSWDQGTSYARHYALNVEVLKQP